MRLNLLVAFLLASASLAAAPRNASASAVSVEPSQSIQAAIDALGATGGTVNLGPGTYTGAWKTAPVDAGGKLHGYKAWLVVPSNVILRGSGPATVLTMPVPGPGFVGNIVCFNGATDAGIEDLQIQGQSSDELHGTTIGVRLCGPCARVTTRNILFSGPDSTRGLNICYDILDDVIPQDLGSHVVEGCRITRAIGTNSGFGLGFDVNQSNGNSITNNTSLFAMTNGRHHVYLSGSCSSNIVSNNRFTGGTWQAIQIQNDLGAPVRGSSRFNLVANNVINGSAGIVLSLNCTSNTVSGNIINGSVAQGIEILSDGRDFTGVSGQSGHSQVCDNNLVSNNYIYRPRTYGILCFEGSNNTFVGNVIVEPNQAAASWAGIYLVRNGPSGIGSSSNRILSNTVTSSGSGAGCPRQAIAIDSAPPAAVGTQIIGNVLESGWHSADPSNGFIGDGGIGTIGRDNLFKGGDPMPTIKLKDSGALKLPDGLSGTFKIASSAPVTVRDIAPSWAGRALTLCLTTPGAVTLLDGAHLSLAGGRDFQAGQGSTITLYCDGSSWTEVSRSIR